MKAPLCIYMAVGDREKLPKFAATRHPPHSAALFSPSRTLSSSGLGSKLKEQARHFSKPLVSLYGGLIYFPHHRELTSKKGGPIQAPPEVNDWLFHYSSTSFDKSVPTAIVSFRTTEFEILISAMKSSSSTLEGEQAYNPRPLPFFL